MKLKDFLELDYKKAMFLSEDECKKQLEELNILNQKTINDVEKFEYTNENGKRYILKTGEGASDEMYIYMYILKQDINDNDIEDFITFSNNLEYYRHICETEEEALEKTKKQNAEYNNQENARNIYRELQNFYNKEYTSDIEKEILKIFDKYDCTVLQIETKTYQNNVNIDKIFEFKTNENLIDTTHTVLVALENNVIIDY